VRRVRGERLWFDVDGLVIGGNNPQACCWMSFADEDEFCLVENFAFVFGEEEDVATIVA
jgi:hypothetical protein